MLTNWKRQEDLQFLNEVSSVPLQQGLRHLQTAFSNFFAGRENTRILRKSITAAMRNLPRQLLSLEMGKYFLLKVLHHWLFVGVDNYPKVPNHPQLQ